MQETLYGPVYPITYWRCFMDETGHQELGGS